MARAAKTLSRSGWMSLREERRSTMGGCRRLSARFRRFAGKKCGRGGLRVIYYWWDAGPQFWLFTLYDKNEMSDLTPAQRKALRAMIKAELEARRNA